MLNYAQRADCNLLVSFKLMQQKKCSMKQNLRTIKCFETKTKNSVVTMKFLNYLPINAITCLVIFWIRPPKKFLVIIFIKLLWFVVYVTIAALISVSLLLFGLLFAAAWWVRLFIPYESYIMIPIKSFETKPWNG